MSEGYEKAVWQSSGPSRSVAVMPDSDELARMMLEISAGWEWGEPRSEVPQTPEHKASWDRLKVEMKEIADMGGIVDIPSGFPDLSSHHEKPPRPPRDTDDSKRRAVTPPGRPLEPEEAKSTSKAESGQIERNYLAKVSDNGQISALYMVEEGPDTLRDMVLHASGWESTSTIADWRFGERSDIDQISREEAKRFAESVNLGGLVR
ncbi:MAG: hypothetical protein CM1200mP26_25280 [Acidimicrobiales bacterium]|nr:MAG: hypothetical protein CM1200mP26_25280 [Acidimicrobiales bacterium]